YRRKVRKLLRLVPGAGDGLGFGFGQPGGARFSGRPGFGWRCFELRVYIWTSSMGKRRTLASPGDAVSGSATGPARAASSADDGLRQLRIAPGEGWGLRAQGCFTKVARV